MPTHPHNKAPTADRLVAGGGFSFDVAQRQNAFARQYTLLYRAVRTLSAPLRPSAPRGRGLRRRPSARRPPFVAPQRQVRAPFGQVHATPPPRSREKPRVSLPASPTGSPPRPGHRGKISHRRGECAQKCARVHFFLFLLAFYAGKTRYICTENLFYQLRMAKSRRFVPVFVCPPEYSPTFLPSL